uniref:Histidine kinase/HSP90-like ATPase domain-containing protein n=1 Tax=Daucus carota subsp. sativus TaxID=79200 RepID=A0A165XAP5_DAUCS
MTKLITGREERKESRGCSHEPEFRDTGIGMTKEELIDCLGTIAQSGTSKILAALKENKDVGADNALIGQFGVGFCSAFLVAEKVVVSAKSPKSDKQYIWEALAESSKYVIKEETDPEKLLRRGTQITLYLRSDDKYEYTEPTKIQNLVKTTHNFFPSPSTHGKKSRGLLRFHTVVASAL